MALYYMLTFTWGIIMNIIGFFAMVGSLMFGGEIHIRYGRLVVEIGCNWGGVTLGNIILVQRGSDESLLSHEIGHSIQNAYMGPLFPFLVGIPSAIRYWYREIIWRKDVDKYYRLPPYDSIWFEHDATERGSKFVRSMEDRRG